MYKIRIVMIAFLLCGAGLTVAGYAQEPDIQKTELNREMTLEREYDPIIQDAAKVNTLPSVREMKITRRPIVYSDYAVPLSPDKELNILPAGALMTGIEHIKRNGYLHAGGGMLMSLHGDFGYHLIDTDMDNLGIYFSHRSMDGNVSFASQTAKPDEPDRKAQINDNIGGLDFKHQFDAAMLMLGGDFGQSTFNYYGIPTNYPLNSSPKRPPYDDSTNQASTYINVRAGVYSTVPAATGYRAMIDYTNFRQKYALSERSKGMMESNVGIDLGVNSPNSDGRYFGANAKINIMNYTPPDSIAAGINKKTFDSRMEFTFNPYLRIERDAWQLLLGLNVMFVSSTSTAKPDKDTSSIFVSPNIAFEAPFAGRSVFYATLGGGIQSNTMAELARTNRYITPLFVADPSRTWADLQLGVRSGASSDFWFDIFGGYQYTEADLFFNPSQDTWINGGFNNVSTYYQPNSQRVQAGATLKYATRQLCDFYLKGVYSHYILEHVQTWKNARIRSDADSIEAYGRPSLVVNAGVNIHPVKPLTLSVDYCMMSGMSVFINGNNEKMSAVNDLRLRASWQFSDRFALYAQFNNLLFQKHERYYGYPLPPFTAMGGLNLNF